jgi:hypothetical protein
MSEVIVVFLVSCCCSQLNTTKKSAMTTASRSLATALPMGALRERLATPSYTTKWDTTMDNVYSHHDPKKLRELAGRM